MPETATATTATAAETRDAGTRMLGFIRGVGGVIVDKLIDVANFVTKDAAGVFQADGVIRARYTPGDGRAKLIVSNTVDGTSAAAAYSEIQFRGGGNDAEVATISAYNSYINVSETGLIFSARDAGNAFGERMRLTGGGRLGLGTASPSSKLHVAGPNATIVTVESTNAGATDTQIRFLTPDRDWRIGQNVGGVGAGKLVIYDVSGGLPRLIFDTTGYMGMGTATPQAPLHIAFADQGAARIRIQNTAGGGRAFDLVAGQNAASQADFSLYDATNGGNLMVWGVTYIRPGGDNSQSAGTASFRFKEVHAVNGTILTSDQREKTWREVSPDDRAMHVPSCTNGEIAAARRIIAELGFFQWNDAIAEKGEDGARYHFGVRAQAVWSIMADEGLVATVVEGVSPSSAYAFLCHDEWEAIAPVNAVEEVRDDDGNIIIAAQAAQPGREAGDRFGVRTDQLALFLITAQEARIAALEAA